jgi:hypothetical protein
VLHHVVDIPAALHGIAETLCPGGTYVLEYANKRNLKAIVRYLLGLQKWSPFNPEPFEFAALNFDFHPDWMAHELARAGVAVDAGLAVSYFRHPLFKRLLPPGVLAGLDRVLQRVGPTWRLAPSIFLRGHTSGSDLVRDGPLFRCPSCLSEELDETTTSLTCRRCAAVWMITDGIYDFKMPQVVTQTTV